MRGPGEDQTESGRRWKKACPSFVAAAAAAAAEDAPQVSAPRGRWEMEAAGGLCAGQHAAGPGQNAGSRCRPWGILPALRADLPTCLGHRRQAAAEVALVSDNTGAGRMAGEVGQTAWDGRGELPGKLVAGAEG